MIYVVNGGSTDTWAIIFLLLAIELVIKKTRLYTSSNYFTWYEYLFQISYSIINSMYFLYGKPSIGENKRRLMHLLTLFFVNYTNLFFHKIT